MNQNEIYIFITIIIIILSPIFSSSDGVWQDYRAGKLLKLRVMVPPGRIKRELQTSRCCRKPQHRKYLQNELRIYGGLGFSGFISEFHKQRREMEERKWNKAGGVVWGQSLLSFSCPKTPAREADMASVGQGPQGSGLDGLSWAGSWVPIGTSVNSQRPKQMVRVRQVDRKCVWHENDGKHH